MAQRFGFNNVRFNEKSLLVRVSMGVKALPYVQRNGIFFALGLSLGCAIEMFMIKTDLYGLIVEKKTTRRLQIDEMKVDLEGDMANWQAQDQQAAQMTKKIQAAQEELSRLKQA